MTALVAALRLGARPQKARPRVLRASTLRWYADFRDSVSGVLTAASNVVLTVWKPDASQLQFSGGSVAGAGTGIYRIDIEVDQLGGWVIRAEADGVVQHALAAWDVVPNEPGALAELQPAWVDGTSGLVVTPSGQPVTVTLLQQLPPAGAIQDADVLPVVRAGGTALATGAALRAAAAAAAPVQSVAGKTGAVTLSPADVGADAAGTAASAIATHQAAANPHPQYATPSQAAAAAPVQSVAGRSGAVTLTSGDLADFNSAADGRVQAARGSAVPLANGTGAAGTSTLFARQDHVHPTDTTRAPLASPALTGTPTAPTAAVNTSTTQIATTAFVLGQVATATPNAPATTGAIGTSTRFAREDHVHPDNLTFSYTGAVARTMQGRAQDVLSFGEWGGHTTTISAGTNRWGDALLGVCNATVRPTLEIPPGETWLTGLVRIANRGVQITGHSPEITDGPTRFSFYPDSLRPEAFLWVTSARMFDLRGALLSYRGRSGLTVSFDAAAGTITRASGDWTAEGWSAPGRKLRFSGLSGAAAGLNGVDFTVINATALTLTVAEALVTQAGMTGVTASMPGMESIVRIDAGSTLVAGPLRVTASAGGRTFTRDSGSWTADGAAAGRTVTFSGFTTVPGNNTTYTITAATATVLTVAAGPAITDVVNDRGVFATFSAGQALSGHWVRLERCHYASPPNVFTTVADIVIRNTKWAEVAWGKWSDGQNAVLLGAHREDSVGTLMTGGTSFVSLRGLLLKGHITLTQATNTAIVANSFEENSWPDAPPSILSANVKAGGAGNPVHCLDISLNFFQDDGAGVAALPAYTAPEDRPTAALIGAGAIRLALNSVRDRQGFLVGSWHDVDGNAFFGRAGTPEQWGVTIPATDALGRVPEGIRVARTNYFGTLWRRGVARGIIDNRFGTVVGDVEQMALQGCDVWRARLTANRALGQADAWSPLFIFPMQYPWRGGGGQAALAATVQNTSPSASRTIRARMVIAQRAVPRLVLTVDTAGGSSTITRAFGSWIADGYAVGQTARFTNFPTEAVANSNVDLTVTGVTHTVLTVSRTMTPIVGALGIDDLLVCTIAPGSPSLITRAGGSWIARGWAVGDLLYLDGIIGGAATNNRRPLTVTAVTDLTLSVSETLAAVVNMQRMQAFRGRVLHVTSLTVPPLGYSPLAFDEIDNIPAVVTGDPPLVSVELYPETAASWTVLGRDARGRTSATLRIVE